MEAELQALKDKVQDCSEDICLATEAILDGLKLVVQGSNQTTSHQLLLMLGMQSNKQIALLSHVAE